MCSSVIFSITHFCDHKGVSSPRGRSHGTHSHPSSCYSSWDLAGTQVNQTELVAAQGCDGADSGSWLPTFLFLLKFKSQIFQRSQSKVLWTVCAWFARSGEAHRKGVRRCFKRDSHTKVSFPANKFCHYWFCTTFLFCKESAEQNQFLGMVILAYLFDCIIKSPIILAKG